MQDFGPTAGLKEIFFALTLEVVFLGFCAVFIGLGWSELKRGKEKARNWALIFLGFALAAVSVYVTKILIQG